MSKIPKIYQLFENRRGYPRLILQTNASVIRSDGLDMEVTLHDISPQGAQLIYSNLDAEKIFPSSISISEFKKFVFSLKTTLNINNNDEEIEINFSPIFQRKIDEKSYSMGILFDKSDLDINHKIENFLIFNLQPAIDDADNLHAIKESPEPVSMDDYIDPKQINDGSDQQDLSDGKLKQELYRISIGIKSLHEAINDLKQTLLKIERKIN